MLDDLDYRHADSAKYRSFATTVTQLKISDFSEENFKGSEVL